MGVAGVGVFGVVPEAVDVDVIVLGVGWDWYRCVAFLTGDDVLEKGGLIAGVVVKYDAETVGWCATGDGPTEGNLSRADVDVEGFELGESAL